MKPAHGGKRAGAGRKPSDAPKAVPMSIALLPADIERLDLLRGGVSRSAWIAGRIRRAKLA